MVILNTEILVCKNKLTNSIKDIMQKVMEKYFDDEVLNKKIENKKKLMQNIIKEKINIVKDNNFWYVNSSDSICTYIHKRGKKEGYMCHRKINTNIEGHKKDYLCCKHSKLHIPKRRIIKNKKSIINKDFDNNNSNKIKSFYNKNDFKKRIKKNKKKNNKVFICNVGILDIGRIIENFYK